MIWAMCRLWGQGPYWLWDWKTDLIHFLALCHKRWLNRAVSDRNNPRFLLCFVFCCSLGPLCLCCIVIDYFFILYVGSGWVVITSASDWLEKLVSGMTYNALMGMLNPAHSLSSHLGCWFVVTLGDLPAHRWLSIPELTEYEIERPHWSRSLSLSLSLCLSLSLSLRFNGHFPGEPGLAGVYWSRGWWRWWWHLDYCHH